MLKALFLASCAVALSGRRNGRSGTAVLGPIEPPVLDLPALPAPAVPVDPIEPPLLRCPPAFPPKVQINGHKAMLLLIGWMRDHGFTGWMPPEDLDEAYAFFCDEEGFVPMPGHELRKMFANAPGVVRDRKRLIDVADPQLCRLYRRLRRRLKVNRAWLYYVPTHEEMQARAVEARLAAEARRAARAAKSTPALKEAA